MSNVCFYLINTNKFIIRNSTRSISYNLVQITYKFENYYFSIIIIFLYETIWY